MLSAADYNVNLLTRKPARWSKQVELQYQSTEGEIIKTFHGELSKISSNPKDVIRELDVIILCMPVSQYRSALHQTGSHLSRKKKVNVGAVYGAGGCELDG